MKTLESKETRAQGNDADNAQFSICYRLNADLVRDRHFSFSAAGAVPAAESLTTDYADQTDASVAAGVSPAIPNLGELNNRLPDHVKLTEDFMRGITTTSVDPEAVQAVRHMLAVEGYLDLAMFEEAAEELRELDPAWFDFEQVLRLQSRVYEGLHQV